MVLVTRAHNLSKLAFRGGVSIINPPLSKFGHMSKFGQGRINNPNTFNTLMHAHCKAGNFNKAFELLDEMMRNGLMPNVAT